MRWIEEGKVKARDEVLCESDEINPRGGMMTCNCHSGVGERNLWAELGGAGRAE